MSKSNSKIILYYVEWPNTKGNHAGMAYLCRVLSSRNKKVKIIKVPERLEMKSGINIKGFRRFNKYFDRFLLQYLNRIANNIIQNLYFFYLLFYLKNRDTLVFMEYLTIPKYRLHQENLAHKLRKAHSRFKIFGLIHLPVNYIINNKTYLTEIELINYLQLLDKIIVFGSSLKKSLESFGFNKKTLQTYHYADTNYYEPLAHKIAYSRLRLIMIGFIMRDYDKLKKIIKNCPGVDFDLCMGRFDFKDQFIEYPNINFYGFLKESELKSLMQNADISLNVIEDTVGSNVITTSMACGLAMIVSDVGSIRDYCDESNAFFCVHVEDYINAINLLSENRDLLKSMSVSSRKKAEIFSLDNFNRDFVQLIRK